MDAAREYREIAARFTALVDGVHDARTWDLRSPVPEWAARDVVGHLVGWFPPFLAGGAGIDLPPGPDVGTDPAAAWHTMSDGLQTVLDDPTTADRLLRNTFIGTLPVPEAVSRFFTTDVFLHSWDLARATGQDEHLDPVRCATLLEGMLPLEDLLRSSGQYGAQVAVGPEADVQSRLLAFIGRDPRP